MTGRIPPYIIESAGQDSHCGFEAAGGLEKVGGVIQEVSFTVFGK